MKNIKNDTATISLEKELETLLSMGTRGSCFKSSTKEDVCAIDLSNQIIP